jgi:hypothetical protein
MGSAAMEKNAGLPMVLTNWKEQKELKESITGQKNATLFGF